jgi:hypothetical protein
MPEDVKVPETPPVPPKGGDPLDAKIVALETKLKEAVEELEREKKKTKTPETPKGEIKGASEDSVHAVLEECKALKLEIQQLKSKKRGWRLF